MVDVGRGRRSLVRHVFFHGNVIRVGGGLKRGGPPRRGRGPQHTRPRRAAHRRLLCVSSKVAPCGGKRCVRKRNAMRTSGKALWLYKLKRPSSSQETEEEKRPPRHKKKDRAGPRHSGRRGREGGLSSSVYLAGSWCIRSTRESGRAERRGVLRGAATTCVYWCGGDYRGGRSKETKRLSNCRNTKEKERKRGREKRPARGSGGAMAFDFLGGPFARPLCSSNIAGRSKKTPPKKVRPANGGSFD